LAAKMGIFRSLQKLRRSARRSRLFPMLFVVGVAAIIFGMIFNARKSELRCCNEGQVVLFFSPSASLSRVCVPIKTLEVDGDLAFVKIEVEKEMWNVAALQTFSVGDLMADLSMKKYPFPLIAVIQDSSKTEYLVVFGKDRQISLSSMKHLIGQGQKNEHLLEVKISNDFSFYVQIK
jgi:hypothetical protein